MVSLFWNNVVVAVLTIIAVLVIAIPIFKYKMGKLEDSSLRTMESATRKHVEIVGNIRKKHWEDIATTKLEYYDKGWVDAVAYERRLVELTKLIPHPRSIPVSERQS